MSAESTSRFVFEDTPEFWLAIARRMVCNARPQKGRSCPRWVAVMDMTAHGSTYAMDLCKYFGKDPHEKVKR
jgi:hypothetical protein